MLPKYSNDLCILDPEREKSPDIWAPVIKELQTLIKTRSHDSVKQAMLRIQIDQILLIYFPEFLEKIESSTTAEEALEYSLHWMNEYQCNPHHEATLAIACSLSSFGEMLRKKIINSGTFSHPTLAGIPEDDLSLIAKNTEWLELNHGCSVWCSFCAFDAPKLSGESFSAMDVLRLIAHGYPENSNTTLYHASDPLDWHGNIGETKLHYFNLHFLVMMVGGYIPFVSTAIPRKSENLVADFSHLIHRISVTPHNAERFKKMTAEHGDMTRTGQAYDGIIEHGAIDQFWYMHKVPNGARDIHIELRSTHEKRLFTYSKRYREFFEKYGWGSNKPIACAHGVLITPEKNGNISNHFVFQKVSERGIGGAPQGYLNVKIIFKRLHEPLPQSTIRGVYAYFHNNPESIIRNLLSISIIQSLHIAESAFVHAQASYGHNAIPLVVSNHTGTMRYIHVPDFQSCLIDIDEKYRWKEVLIPFSEQAWNELFSAPAGQLWTVVEV